MVWGEERTSPFAERVSVLSLNFPGQGSTWSGRPFCPSLYLLCHQGRQRAWVQLQVIKVSSVGNAHNVGDEHFNKMYVDKKGC